MRVIGLAVVLALGLALAPLAVEAQTSKVLRIGVIWPTTPAATSHFNEAFTQGLREHGYVEGQNVTVERRYGESRVERTAEVAAELVRMKMDVIVAASDQTVAAVKRQTQSIPVVMVGASDAVGTGFVASLARPGGNVTGLSRMSTELSGKRLELLREAVPRLARVVAVMWDPNLRGALLDFKELEGPARSLRLQLQSLEVSTADDLDRALSAITAAQAEALIVITPHPVAFQNRGRLASFAQKNRLPSLYANRDYVDAGGLMSYGPNTADLFRRAATYVDKILKGAKPADLPVEQPTNFELVINLKTAKALGLTIPQTLLLRADQVIQ
jgi:putative ABC transport system substrate-binding protein